VLDVAREGAGEDLFGYSLTVLPDRSGDGIPEILVGSPEWNLGDRFGEQFFVEDVGAAEIVSGADGSSILIWVGETAGERLGEQVVRLGDTACVATLEGVVLVCWKAGSILGSIRLDSPDGTSGK